MKTKKTTGKKKTLIKSKVVETKHDGLKKRLEQVIRADGYLVMITHRSGDTLHHTYFTNKFRHDDMIPTLDEHAKMLQQEIRSKT